MTNKWYRNDRFSELTQEEHIEKLRHSIKFRSAFVNSITVFFIIGAVSAVLAVFIHSVMFLPAWASIVLGSCALLFITMLALEYSE